ncbi:MAG: DUF932 domain-containing protein [Tenuifilaceae bacterium]|nr:DUF932 domain-containing protein [Tenuifilaceae bacterium]
MKLREFFDEKGFKEVQKVVFPVKKVQLSEILANPSITALSGISHAVVVNNNHVVNFCSEDYFLRENYLIIEEIAEILCNEGFKFDFKAQRFKSSRFKMDFIIKEFTRDLGSPRVGDPVSISITVHNSYDGSMGFRVSISMFRLICSNGMVAPTELMNIKKVHTGQMLDFLDISSAEITRGITYAAQLLDESVQYYYDLMDFKVRNLDFLIDHVIEETKFPTSLAEMVKERILYEVGLGFELSHWTVYNGFNYAINHGSQSLVGRKGNILDTAVLDFLLT